MESIRRCVGIRALQWTRDGVWGARRREALFSRDLGATWESRGALPGHPLDALARIRILERAARRSITLLHASGEHWLAVAGGVLHFDGVPVRDLEGSRPMERGLCASGGTLFLAEYRRNLERSAVSILKSEDSGRTWIPACTFAPGEVRHVHAIQEDPFRPGRLWACTGDEGGESRILFSDDGFRTHTVFCADGQRSRAVSLLFTADAVVWGMDAPGQPAFLLTAARADGRPRELQRVGGPVYYSGRNAAGAMFFSTAAEGGLREAEVWVSRAGGSWSRELLFRKDGWPQRGILGFPSGEAPGSCLALTGRALRGIDGATLFLHVS
ncbi:MAG: hypothetical protein ACT4PV_01185 [Planctomycetaceae bacterium]